jgi:hypothetical protein
MQVHLHNCLVVTCPLLVSSRSLGPQSWISATMHKILLIGILGAFLAGPCLAAQPVTIVDQNGVPLNPLPTLGVTSNPIVQIRQTATTSSAVALPSNVLTNGLVCTIPTTNTGVIYIGPAGVTTSTGYGLGSAIGQYGISYGVANSNQVYIIGTNTSDVMQCTGN